MRIIAIINQKGGVGKTTVAVNLVHALALRGKKVVAIDLDPQGHLTAGFGLFDPDIAGMDQVLLGGSDIETRTVDARKNVRLVPAGGRLVEIEQIRDSDVVHGELLKEALQGKFQDQDFVFLDCPPSSGVLVINALLATQEVLIPVSCDYLGLHGLSYLLGTFQKFKSYMEHEIRQQFVVTRYHKRRNLSAEVMKKLLDYFPDQVLATPIREMAAIAECPSFGKTIFEYKKRGFLRGNYSDDFSSLAEDFLKGRMMNEPKT